MIQNEWVAFADGRRLTIEIEPGDKDAGLDAEMEAEVDAAWEKICTANPRAFDGPILAFVSADPANNIVRARRDNYRRLAVQPEIGTGITLLGVTGVLEARDRAGVGHVLLGLRSHATRVFGGMWEFGPSGGVEPPEIGQASMDAGDLWGSLVGEIREEIGLPTGCDQSPPIGLLCDPSGQSVELVFRVSLLETVEELAAMIEASDRSQRWEYDAVRWVAIGGLGSFAATSPCIPSTAGLIELFGEV